MQHTLAAMFLDVPWSDQRTQTNVHDLSYALMSTEANLLVQHWAWVRMLKSLPCGFSSWKTHRPHFGQQG